MNQTEENNIITKGLNPPQKEAVEHIKGALLVLAGAGSGKTKVLTHRIANMVDHGIAPSQILAVTFTNKAAKEMESRISKLLAEINTDDFQSYAQKPSVGTFHSICVRILRQDIEHLGEGYNNSFVIFDSADNLSLIKTIMKTYEYDIKDFKPRAILSHISSIKSSLCSPTEHFQNNDKAHTVFADVVTKLYPIFIRKMIQHNALDFDDLILKVVHIFEKKPEILKKYQNRWPYILVDEYQDTNFVQYKFIQLLVKAHKNLCVVGDDHQSIYAFRGADFRNILDFEKDFPKAKVVKLEQNYRSSGNILSNANYLISYNETGREKKLWTEQESGSKIKIQETVNEKEEGNSIVESIKEYKFEGIDYDKMAILYRMNAQSRSIEESLLRNRIPYQIVGGVRFFDRKEIKDVMSYLRLIFNPRDDVALQRIINVPARKIGPATINVLQQFAQEYDLSLFDILEEVENIETLSPAKKKDLINFRNIIFKLQRESRDKPISILLDRVVEGIDFYKFLNDGTSEGEARIENVKELFSVASRYDSSENSLADFLEGVALISDLDNMNDGQSAVTLMTIHASKGLEFPVVFLPGWEEDIFPSSSARTDKFAEEEERRLGYVAITRAEQHCTILHARQRMLFGRTEFKNPSKFLNELNEKAIERDRLATSSSGAAFVGTYDSPAYKKRAFANQQQERRSKPTFDHILLNKMPESKQEAQFGIKENNTGFKAGDKIKHVEYGEGTIIMISGDVISAAFKGLGMKKMVASMAPIEKIED